MLVLPGDPWPLAADEDGVSVARSRLQTPGDLTLGRTKTSVKYNAI